MRERFTGELPFLRNVRKLVKPQVTPESSHQYLESRTKRMLDILVGVGGLGISWPIMLLAGGVNKILEPCELAFYETKRVGKCGGEIVVRKIRSVKSADIGETERGEIDPTRISWFGQFLRRTAIDELPQLLNVLRGEMSIVGPRVLSRGSIKDLETSLSTEEFKKWEQAYFTYKPALTGLRQILGNRDLSYHQQTKFDRFYLEHANLGFDLYIILATPFALIRGRGIR